MQAISVGQGCTRVRRDRRKELLLVVLELHLCAAFSLSALPYQGGGREGEGVWGLDLQNRSPRLPAPTGTTIIIIFTTVIVPRSLIRNAPHQGGVLRPVRDAPEHGSRQQQKKKGQSDPRTHQAMGVPGLSSFRLFVSQAHSNRSIALLLIVKGAGGGSGMLHHTKVNDCVTEAGCNKQSGMTHFPDGWTRLGRRCRWLASPSGLARERAREKKKKGGTVHPRISLRTAAVAVVEGGIHGARKGKKFLAGRGRLAGRGWARTGTCQTGPPTLGVHTTLPRSIGPKPGPVKPLTRKQAVKSGALCPLPAFPAGPSPRGRQRQGAGNQGAPSVPRGGEGMPDAFQVWLGGSTHLWLTHPLVMLAGRHDETVLSSSSFVLTLTDARVRMMVLTMREMQRRAAASTRRTSLAWKRGWIVDVLIEIGLREISQRDAGEVAGREVMSSFPARRGPE